MNKTLMEMSEERKTLAGETLAEAFPEYNIWVEVVDYGQKLDIAISDRHGDRRHHERVHVPAVTKGFLGEVIEDARRSLGVAATGS